VDADPDTLATARYATPMIWKAAPERALWRPPAGICPRITHAALLGFASEARWLRFARNSLRRLFPYLPAQPGATSGFAGPSSASRRDQGLTAVLARDATLWIDDV